MQDVGNNTYLLNQSVRRINYYFIYSNNITHIKKVIQL